MSAPAPIILGLAGLRLAPAEAALFRAANPAGFILFARNCAAPDQLRALTEALRESVGRAAPILIDQEGGRVARLRPPAWPAFPAAAAFGARYAVAPMSAIAAAQANGRAIATVLRAAGIDVDCLPVLDVPAPDADPIIGDRAYGEEPMRVAALGAATLLGLAQGGVVGILKHIPGHGRARADSHLALPVVEASVAELERDFEPFRRLAGRARAAMTAHIVYTALDPQHCASLSPGIIAATIRRDIGFDGLLMSDDIDMAALAGPLPQRAAGVLAAGCDLALHCSGEMAAMEAILGALPAMTPAAAARLERLRDGLGEPEAADHAALAAERDALLGLA